MTAEKAYYIVNPKGTIHIVTEDHARARLRIVGWRLATKEEIAAYIEAAGEQRHNKPLAARWNPVPPETQELPEGVEIQPKKKAQKRGEAKPPEA